MFFSYLEVEKTGSQLFRAGQTLLQLFGQRQKWIPAIQRPKNVVHNCQELVPSYFEPDKHCCSYLDRDKSGSLLFRDQKMQFTTVRSKEKDYDIYLKSEKLVHSNQEHEKNVSQLF